MSSRKGEYVVLVSTNLKFFGIKDALISKIFSYKKEQKGIKLTLDINKAHIYKSEKTAYNASSYYGGQVIEYNNFINLEKNNKEIRK